MSNAFGEKKVCWSRSDISACQCEQKSYRHVHCPCARCNGRATDKSTELRHWNETCQLAASTSTNIHVYSNLDDMDMDIGEYDFDGGAGDISGDDNSVGDGHGDASDQLLTKENNDGRNAQQSSSKSTDHDMPDLSTSGGCDNPNIDQNPLKRIVVKAVLDALRIKNHSGVSVKTFEDVLEYGKNQLFTSLREDVDVEILTTLWPKSWNDVQLLLKEKGFEDAKEFYICFCHDEKELTRDGKSTKKFVYNGKYSVMENKHDKCSHWFT